MALTKQTVIDKIEVTENGVVQVRQATRIIEDGVQLSQSYHRWTIAPGQNYSDQDAKVKAICDAAHTEAVIEAYEEALAAAQERMGAA
jgi:hypothetical protein